MLENLNTTKYTYRNEIQVSLIKRVLTDLKMILKIKLKMKLKLNSKMK